MKKDVIILGSGITGLTIGRLLTDDPSANYNVKILESSDSIGGIAKTRNVDGISYHTTGGHCFNSKHKEVLDFVFNLLPKDNWHLVQRISNINLGEYEVSYPIEFSMKEIFKSDQKLSFNITKDFLSSNDDNHYKNLEDWFVKKFGKTLALLYFIPYNKKIWNMDPQKMSHLWVEDKLPIPNKISFFNSLMGSQSDTMPHSTFFYPNSNNQNSLIEVLAKGLEIELNHSAIKIKKRGLKWIINDTIECDYLISTIPLNILPTIIEECPQEILESAKLLKYNKVTTMLWESKKTIKTWTYQPSPDTLFHRYIHIGNFFIPQTNHTITESIGSLSYEEMLRCGQNDPSLIKPLSYNVSDHAYVVFDQNRNSSVQKIQSYLNSLQNIWSIGRFGQWEYFNMDICMKSAMELHSKISQNL